MMIKMCFQSWYIIGKRITRPLAWFLWKNEGKKSFESSTGHEKKSSFANKRKKNHSLEFFYFITPDIARMVTLDFETAKNIKESTSCVNGFQEKRKTFSLLERSRCADSFAAVPSSKTLTFSLLLLVHCCTVWPTSVLIILFFTRVWSQFWNQCFFQQGGRESAVRKFAVWPGCSFFFSSRYQFRIQGEVIMSCFVCNMCEC